MSGNPFEGPQKPDPILQPTPIAESSEARNWAMCAHLSTLTLYVGIPFGNIIAPLIIWLIKRDQSVFVADHAKEAMNFAISLTIYGIISGILVCAWIGIVLLPAVIIFHIVATILAAMAASAGNTYRYPLTIRFVT